MSVEIVSAHRVPHADGASVVRWVLPLTVDGDRSDGKRCVQAGVLEALGPGLVCVTVVAERTGRPDQCDRWTTTLRLCVAGTPYVVRAEGAPGGVHDDGDAGFAELVDAAWMRVLAIAQGVASEGSRL